MYFIVFLYWQKNKSSSEVVFEFCVIYNRSANIQLKKRGKVNILNGSLRRPRRKIPSEIAAKDGGVSISMYDSEQIKKEEK